VKTVTTNAQRRRAACMGAMAIGLLVVALGCGTAPTTGRSPLRAPDVAYEPTPDEVVAQMLDLARVGLGDVVYDLGCGDGRIVIAAIRDRRAARGVCVDIDPRLIDEARRNAARAGVAEHIEFRLQDLFQTKLADATVVTLFLSPDLNRKLRPKLTGELKPGTRIVSYMHDMGNWAPISTRNVESAYGPSKLYLWVIPVRP